MLWHRATLSRAWIPWLLWAWIAALASAAPWNAAPELSRWLAYLAVFGFISSLWGERERRYWVWALALAVPVLAGASFWTGWTALRIHGGGEGMWGLLPPYYNYTMAVLSAAAAAVFAASLHPRRPRGAELRWLLAAAALAGATILVARSRGALAALAAAALVAALRREALRRLLAPALLIGAMAAALTVFFMARFGYAPSYLLKTDKTHVFKRPQLWRAAAAAAGQSPALGWGPGSFEAVFPRVNFPSGHRLVRYQYFTPHAHSEPLELAAETGWVGLALLLLAGLAALRPRPPGESSWTQDAGLAAAAALVAMGMVDNLFHVPALGLLLASAAGCACRPPEGRGWPAAWAAGGAAALALAAAGVARLEAGADPARRAALRPLDFEARQALAVDLLARGRPGAALLELERASELNPKSALLLIQRAELLRAAGRWAQAEPLIERALELEPHFVQARLLRAERLLRRGQRREARAELELAQELFRRHQAPEIVEARYPYEAALGSLDEGRLAELLRRLRP